MNKLILKDFYSKLIFNDPKFIQNRKLVKVPDIRSSFGRSFFSYFLPKFINSILKHSGNLPPDMFNQGVFSNLLINFNSFSNNFNHFY